MLRTLILFFAILFVFASCAYDSHPHGRPLPPGHAKKLNGSKSAKPFAPGQNK